MVTGLVVHSLWQHASVSEHRSRRARTFYWPLVGYVILLAGILSLCLRLSWLFRACREEQQVCEPTAFAQPLSAILVEFAQLRNFRFLLSVISVISVICTVTAWLRYCGNMNGTRPLVIMMSYAIPAVGVFLPTYWVFDGLLTSGISRAVADSARISLPRLIYVLSTATVAIATIWPLTIFMLRRSREHKDDATLLTRLPDLHQMSSPQQVVPQIYNHIRTNWKSVLTTQSTVAESSSPSNQPLVYGLGTVYSASHLVMWLAVAMVMMLLLGDNMALSVALLTVVLVCVLELHASQVHCQQTEGGGHSDYHVPWSSIVLVCFIASERFFSTGHQATIAGIRWEAAFHGFHGDHSTVWIPALLVSLNTFTGHILCTLALPLLVYWPFTRGHSKTSAQVENKGEFVLNEDGGQQLKRSVYLLFAKFIFLSAVKVLFVMCCVTIHRRHLMVWKIFAPRFVYEAAIFVVVSFVSILTYLFVARLNYCLSNWVRALCKMTD
jgi:phosphatidylinositol glycan class O